MSEKLKLEKVIEDQVKELKLKDRMIEILLNDNNKLCKQVIFLKR